VELIDKVPKHIQGVEMMSAFLKAKEASLNRRINIEVGKKCNSEWSISKLKSELAKSKHIPLRMQWNMNKNRAKKEESRRSLNLLGKNSIKDIVSANIFRNANNKL